MKNYINKVKSEFEENLLNLSKNPSANYWDARKQAEQYTKDFVKRKSLGKDDYRSILDICLDIIQDWFPDTSVQESQITF